MDRIYYTGSDRQIEEYELERFLRFLPIAATAVIFFLFLL